MTQEDYVIAKELKNRLSEVVELLDFRVFGSRASGTKDEYSDMDVFLEIESLDKDIKEKISDIVWEVSFEHLVVITPLIFTRYEIEKSPLKASSIVRSILEEGIVV